MARALIFPGQGSQKVGMGRTIFDTFAEARMVFEEVNDALNQNLSHLMFNGPEDELILTQNAQPAIMTSSLAIVKVLTSQGGLQTPDIARCVAGHSLGEYSALTAANALKLADTARLLKTRGEAMQAASPLGQGKMAAILGLDLGQVEDVAVAASTLGICEIANDNAPGQIVLSGETKAIDNAIELAKKAGAKRAIPLDVSAPFHCALLEPAAIAMSEALKKVTISPLNPPLICNVSASETDNPNIVRERLVEQVTKRVRWHETIQLMPSLNIETVVEIGSGKVLTNLNKRINRDLVNISLEQPSEIDAFLNTI